MKITFANNLERCFSSEKEIRKKYGKFAIKIMQRISELLAANSLEDISPFKPSRLHMLIGKERGIFSVDISPNFRLLFKPIGVKIPLSKEIKLILSEVTEIQILEIKDTH